MPPRTLRVRSRMWRRCMPRFQRYPRHAPGSPNPQSVPFVTRSVTGCMPTRSIGTISGEADLMIVHTLCVGMPPRTLRVRSRMWRRCAPRLQRYPRHAPGSPNPQSVPFVTRSVTGGMPTRSIGTISGEADLMIVHTLCVGMPPRTLRVRSRMWRRCAPRLQRYPRHAPG